MLTQTNKDSIATLFFLIKTHLKEAFPPRPRSKATCLYLIGTPSITVSLSANEAATKGLKNVCNLALQVSICS